jgi:nucleoside kinase
VVLIVDKMDLDLLVFGDTAIDNFYEVEKLPEEEEAQDIKSSRRFFGGMGANTALAAKKLGLNVGLVSVIGTDAEDYRKHMETQGIKMYLKGIFGDTTKSLFFKTDKNHISFFQKGVTEMLNDLDPKVEFGKRLPKKVKTTYMARTYLKMHYLACKHYPQSLKVLNPGYGTFKLKKNDNIFKRLMRLGDTIVLNHHEARHLSSIGYKLRFNRRQTYIVTRGPQGARIYKGNTMVDIPTFKTTVVDAAGAGDAFNAGYIAAIQRGLDTLESVKFANAVASFVVEKWGCQTNLPTWEDAMERYEKIRGD